MQSALDGRLDFWPGVADVWLVVRVRWTARCEAKCRINEFWIGTVCAPGRTRYLWRDRFIWDGSEKGVEVLVGLARLRRRGHRK